MIAIVDYGVGNLFSLKRSLEKIGAASVITADKKIIASADKLILPGVGAFGDAAKKLKESGLGDFVKAQAHNGKPLLGICLGMQLLFDKSYEYGEHEGLGLIKGSVEPLSEYISGLKVPHMGWNSLNIVSDCPLLKDLKQGDYVYFVHSYFAKCVEGLVATATYGIDVTAAVGKGNVFGMQFHPEKSGANGLKILKAFADLKA